MKLGEFLKKVGGKVESIVTYSGKDALKAVEKNGYALRYVNASIFEADGNTKKRQTCTHCGGSGEIEE